MTGVPPTGSGCQPAASAAEEASSRSGIPNAVVERIREQVIEEIIGWVSEPSFREVRGILARRKRDREDAALRGDAYREERSSIIEMIRGRKRNRIGSVMETLRDIRDGNFGYARGLTHWQLLEAQLLAERGLAVLTCEMAWSRGLVSGFMADTEWRARLTEKGKKELASAIEARSDATPKSGAAEGESAGPKDDAQPDGNQ